MTAIRGAEVDFVVDVSKGTHTPRSLAHDIGRKLWAAGRPSALRRTRIGEFNVADSMTPEEWSERLAQEER